MDANSILQIARGYWESRVLLTGAELNVFTLLSDKSLSLDELADRLRADRRGLGILLDALAAMELLQKTDDGYFCPAEIGEHLSEDSPNSVLPMVLHLAGLWKKWSKLTDIVEKGRVEETALEPMPVDQIRAFIGAMHVVGRDIAMPLVEKIGVGPARKLLDVGGASGTYTIAFLQAEPEMRATIFDQPEVIDMAKDRLTKEGLLHRTDLVPGDFYTDELPGGHDLALISAIIHQNSPKQNLDLYRKVYRALEAGGRIVIRDQIMNPDRTTPRPGAIFAINMLVATEGGNTYTFDEIKDGLSEAGFERVNLIQAGERMDGLVEAFKP